MIKTRLLVRFGVGARDVGEAIIVIGVTVANKARPVVRLDVGMFETDYVPVVVVSSFVVADPEIGMAKAARPEGRRLLLTPLDLSGYLHNIAPILLTAGSRTSSVPHN